MKFIELFAGIGGFRLGLERHGHECVYASEWLEKPASIYERNFGDKPDGRDIRTIDPLTIPRADLICGGFPCATFSVAGKRTGFSDEDSRGSLFFEICRFLRITRTPYVFLENVKGLLSSDNGRTFGVILFTLDSLGYDIQWEVLNSSNFGVPQNRERVFIIGHLRGHPRPKVFPIGETKGEDAECQKEGEEAQVAQWRRGYFREYKSNGTPTLTANMGTGGHNVPFVKAVITPNRENKRQNGRRFKEDGEPAFTLGAQDRHGVYTEKGIRKLTPLECERLQGLPDGYTKYYADGSIVSDSERYERCGRTVTISVIEEIAKKLGKEWY